MPISTLHEAKCMTNQQLADLALQADQESRRLMRTGQMQQAREAQAEAERLCALTHR